MNGRSEQGHDTFDAVAVGAMALHDRAFFAALLESPRQAIEAKAEELHLQVKNEDIELVIELISARKGTSAHGLQLWDRWKATGLWDIGDWPRLWAPPVFPHP